MFGPCKAILWDVGGTLVDFALSLPEATRRRLDFCGVDHSGLLDEHIEKTYADFIGGEPEWRTIDDEYAAERRWYKALLPGELFDETALARMPRYFGLYRPVPGMIRLLDELRERRLPMAIVSNWPPSLVEFLGHHELKDYFDPIVYSGQDGIHKPDVQIFNRALSSLRIDPRDVAFIGDNPALDIVPARTMGMRTIHFDPRRKTDSRDADEVMTLRKLIWTMLER